MCLMSHMQHHGGQLASMPSTFHNRSKLTAPPSASEGEKTKTKKTKKKIANPESAQQLDLTVGHVWPGSHGRPGLQHGLPPGFGVAQAMHVERFSHLPQHRGSQYAVLRIT